MPNEIWTGARYYVLPERSDFGTKIYEVYDRHEDGAVTEDKYVDMHFHEAAALSQAKRLDFEYRQQQLDL